MGLGIGQSRRTGNLARTEHRMNGSRDVGEAQMRARWRQLARGEHVADHGQDDDREPTDDKPSAVVALDRGR